MLLLMIFCNKVFLTKMGTVTNGIDSSHLHRTGNLIERDIRIEEDVLDFRREI